MNYKKVLAFTLIELLIVIAVIGILASIVLVSLQSARVSALNASYLTYVTGSINLVRSAIHAGEFDSITSGNGCLGIYSECWGAGSVTNIPINNALSAVGTIPVGQYPQEMPTRGLFMWITGGDLRVYVAVGPQNRDAVCDNIPGSVNGSSWYCYVPIPL